MKKMNNKIRDWVTIIGFLIILFVPNMIVPLIDSVFNTELGKNTESYEAPQLTIDKIAEYPDSFDEYYNNNLPFRDVMGKAWANFNYFVFKDSTNDGVIFGKVEGDDEERWMFYDSKTDYSPIKDAQGLTDLNKTKMNKMVDRIKENTSNLKEQNIKLYYLVVPSKESIYKEMMPDSVEFYAETTRADKFYDYALEAEVSNVIYPKDELVAAKDLGQLYWKQDTHWNELGAGTVFKGMIGKLKSGMSYDFDYEFKKEQVDKDLTKMLKVNGYFEDEVVAIEHKSGSDEYNIEQKEGATSDIVVSKNEDAPIHKTVMVVGDSYRNAMKTFFFRMFEECIFLHRSDYKHKMLEDHDVDIVVSEYVERYLPTLDKFKL